MRPESWTVNGASRSAGLNSAKSQPQLRLGLLPEWGLYNIDRFFPLPLMAEHGTWLRRYELHP